MRRGVIYLLHFDTPYRHARHYLGFTSNITRRLDRQEVGRGARLLQVIADADIEFRLVRQWIGTRSDERRIKNGSHVPNLCPACTANARRIGFLEEV